MYSMYTSPYFSKNILQGKSFWQIREQIKYHNFVFLIYCMYTPPNLINTS